jgi:hypothetical protein
LTFLSLYFLPFFPHYCPLGGQHIFLAERRSPEAMLQQIVPVLVKQDLLLECKPLEDWMKVAVVQDNGTYILGVNPDPVLLAVNKVLMDHRMVLHKSDLPSCWAPLPPTQAIATGSDVLIAEELGAMRRAQEQAVADKKKTPKKRWGVEQVSKLVRLTRVPSESELPPIYTALAVGKEVSPRPHYTTKCVRGSLLRGWGSNYYCPHCDTHLRPRHWGSGLCWCQH